MSGSEIVGVVLAIPGLIDLGIKYGQDLRRKVELFMHTSESSRLLAFIVELTAGQINELLEFFSNMNDSLPLQFKNELEISTRILNGTLEKAISAFPDDTFVDDRSKFSRLKHALYDERKIREAVAALEIWSTRFTERATVFLLLLSFKQTPIGQLGLNETREDVVKLESTASRRLGTRLAEARRQAQHGPSLVECPNELTKLDHTELYKSVIGSTIELVDVRPYAGMDEGSQIITRRIVQNLAKLFREVDAETMGLLHCRGFSDNPLRRQFGLHFDIPGKSTNPRSLRSLLADPVNSKGRKHSLSDRIRLAHTIAKAVLFVHASGFVHKNVRPENIIVFEPETFDDATKSAKKSSYPYAIGNAYLTGYDGMRKDDASSARLEERDPVKRIYLPTERLTTGRQNTKFSWKHDVYSLGVVLMEVAFWQSFASNKDIQQSADLPKQLRERYLPQMPRLLGDKHYDAVKACLDMLEGDSAGEEIRDEDDVVLGASYISQILDQLESISV